MTDTKPDLVSELAPRIRSMVATFVHERTQSRSGIKRESREDPTTKRRSHIVPEARRKDYHEALAKVCEQAFLDMRSARTREDFVRYFTGTVCAQHQYVPEYEKVAIALLSDGSWEDVKALAMLSLSSLWPTSSPDGHDTEKGGEE